MDPSTSFADTARRHARILGGVARSFATGADRDDLLQEMLLALWHALPAFRGDASESTFAYRVALNTALAWTRRQPAPALDLELVEAPACSAFEPMADAIASQRTAAVDAAIARLSPIDRALLLLHLDGVSYRDAAEVLGISATNVGARLTRARQRLATLLQGDHA